TDDVRHSVGLRRVLYVGGVPGRALHLRSVPVAVLLARALRRLAACVVRPEARLVACVAAVLPGPADPAVSGALPAHLLLLSRGLLQSVLGRPALVRRRRAARAGSRWAFPPACH